ncbi:hypothetical protein SAMN05421803_1582 [Nocardiopsis flavescens]|uniref:Uncharacterized protein n=1 Tax=Nocardiopsis flavescens TaxID=758803 RepID=A0A1M6X0S6_9ACTN|nr:hypothetical protein [Nocardiopsis flavescens]SHK99523.1 hypothetical protein SAMN05421803_1582 [Nocardiopsis flavescens]
MQWHPRHEEPTVLQIRRELLIVPSLDPQCVARTRRGQRCKNGIISHRGASLYDQDRPSLLWSTRGLLPVWRARADPEEIRAWTEQRCSLHDTPEATDHTAPEWYRFDPDRDTAFIRPLPSWPRLPALPREWSTASQELGDIWGIGHVQHHGPPAGAFIAPGWLLEPAPASSTAAAMAALEEILAGAHGLPTLDWTLTADGRLAGALPDEPVTDLDERGDAFARWAHHLGAAHRTEHRRKGYLELHARAEGPVPVTLQTFIADGIA